MAILIRVIDNRCARECDLCQADSGAQYKVVSFERFIIKECMSCGRLYIYRQIEEGGS